GLIFGKIIGKLIQKLLKDLKLDSTIRKGVGVNLPIEHTISTFITYFIYFIAIIMALNQLGLTTDVLNIISAAVMAIIILSIFLGIKDFIPNVMSGIVIHNKDFLHDGDRIKVDTIEGKITHINLIETKIETDSGDVINVPNSMLTKNKVIKKKDKGKE
ncbi:MAG: mechanosensitive ion channel domain-containing protein, partial [Nanobdellota archaeon]